MNNKKKMIVAFSILLVAILFIGGVYAWLKISVVSNTENIVHAGKLELILDDDTSAGIQMKDTVPLTDENGRNQEGYTFSLINRGTISSQYTIYLDDLDIEDGKVRMNDSVVQYIIERDGREISSGLLPNLGSNPNRILDTGVIDANTTYVYKLKVWMDKDATNEYMGTVFFTKIRVEAEQTNTTVKKSELELTPASKQKVPLKNGESPSDFTYTSSDLDVVRVDEEGNIEVVGPGYASIIKTDQIGRKEEITVHVTVPVEATFETNDKIESIGSVSNNTCNLTENDQSTCKIEVPEVEVVDGYEFVGWSTNPNSHEGEKGKVQVSNTDKTLYPIVKVPGKTLTATFEEQGDGIESIEYESLTCETQATYNDENPNTSCEITLPKMTVKEGYRIVGWNTSGGATSGEPMGGKVMIGSNTTYYTIYTKAGKTLTATFMLNGAKSLNGQTASQLENEALEISCEVADSFNGETETSCEIEVPTIEASDATPIVIGFNEDRNANKSSISNMITISENKTYYALTKSEEKTYTATFYRNGAVSLNEEGIDFQQESCHIPPTYNGVTQDSSCSIITPTIEASASTPNVLGYSTSSENHKCDYQAGVSIQIQESAVYYAQTSSDTVSYTVRYEPGSNVSNIREEHGTCTVPLSYNGEKQKESCTVVAPDYDVASGYQKLGFSETADDTSGHMNLVLSKDTTIFYANASAEVATVEYYSEGTKIGSSRTNGNSVTLIPSEELNIVKSGYSFKGWTTMENTDRVTYDDGGTINNLYNTEVRKIYAVWEDKKSPVCHLTFPSGSYTVDDTITATLVCEDQGSGMIDLGDTKVYFESSKENGSIAHFTETSQSCNYQDGNMTCSIELVANCVSSNATLTLPGWSIGDKSSNRPEDVISNAVTIKGKTFTATMTSEGVDGVSTLGSTTKSCTTELNSQSCTIELGTDITVSDGYRWAGWSVSTNQTRGAYKFILSEDVTFYPVVGSILVDAYTYNENSGDANYCVTGEESSCQTTTCYQNGGKCPIGTIFKYATRSDYLENHRVNSLDKYVYYFHVLHDDGDKLTLQQREYLSAGQWSGNENNISEGPIIAIGILEELTKDWSYVDDITYAYGTTEFLGNSFTGCTNGNPINCSKNVYVWTTPRTTKARIVTAQELSHAGCNIGDGCPMWAYNYLSECPKCTKKGSYNSYWLSNVLDTTNAFRIYGNGHVVYGPKGDAAVGIRPVIELTKTNLDI